MRRMPGDFEGAQSSVDLALPLDMAAARLHEICNQITTLRAYTELAQEMADDERTVTRYLQNMMGRMDELESTLREVLCIARTDSNSRSEEKISSTRLYDIIMDVTTCLSPRMHKKNIEIDITVSPDSLSMRDNRARWFKRILHNLLDNAADVSPRGGRISILCHCNPSRDLVYICVQDEGPGLPGHARETIFRPYFTTKRNGIGLGLFLARRMARERLEGDLVAESRNCTGTAFVLSLPGRLMTSRTDGGPPSRTASQE